MHHAVNGHARQIAALGESIIADAAPTIKCNTGYLRTVGKPRGIVAIGEV